MGGDGVVPPVFWFVGLMMMRRPLAAWLGTCPPFCEVSCGPSTLVFLDDFLGPSTIRDRFVPMVGWPPGPFASTAFFRRLALGWAALRFFTPPLVLLPVPMRTFPEIMIRGTPCFSARFARSALFGGTRGLRWAWNSLRGTCIASTLTTLSTFSTNRLRAGLSLFHDLDW